MERNFYADISRKEICFGFCLLLFKELDCLIALSKLRLGKPTDHLDKRCSRNQTKESPADNCNFDSRTFFQCIICKCKSLHFKKDSDELQRHK